MLCALDGLQLHCNRLFRQSMMPTSASVLVCIMHHFSVLSWYGVRSMEYQHLLLQVLQQWTPLRNFLS